MVLVTPFLTLTTGIFRFCSYLKTSVTTSFYPSFKIPIYSWRPTRYHLTKTSSNMLRELLERYYIEIKKTKTFGKVSNIGPKMLNNRSSKKRLEIKLKPKSRKLRLRVIHIRLPLRKKKRKMR